MKIENWHTIKNRRIDLHPSFLILSFFAILSLVGSLLALAFTQPTPALTISPTLSNQQMFYFGTNVHPENIYPVANGVQIPQEARKTTNDFAIWTQALKNAGFTMLRGGIDFSNIAPTQDKKTWNWSGEDEYINQLLASKIEPLIILGRNANWLPSPYNANATLEERTTFINAFADFAQEHAKRYKGKIKYYNIWNEPSLTYFWTWSTTDFARLVSETSYRMKLEDPTIKIMFDTHALDHMINPSLGFQSQGTFATKVLDTHVTLSNGTTVQTIDSIDIIAGHSYPDRTSSIPENLRGKEMSYYYEYMNNYLKWKYGSARGSKEYFHTETGYAARNTSLSGRWVSESKQAALLARATLNLSSSTLIKAFLQYDLQDDGTNNNQYEHRYGIMYYNYDLNNNLIPKPGYTGLKNLITSLDNTSFISKEIIQIDSSKKIFKYLFASNDYSKKVWAIVLANNSTPLGALNTTITQNYTLKNLLQPTVTVSKLDGSQNQINATNGTVTIAISEDPIFIIESPILFYPGTYFSPTPQDTPVSTNTPIPTQNPTSQPTPTSMVTTPTPTVSPTTQSFITITQPIDNTTLTGAISVKAEPISSYASNTKNIKIYIDGAEKKYCNYATNICSYWWNPTSGSHTIYATGYDKANNFTTSPTITVYR